MVSLTETNLRNSLYELFHTFQCGKVLWHGL